MKAILLSKNKVALVSEEDFEYLNQWKWSASQESREGLKWYAIRWSLKSEHGDGKRFKIRMHRVILGLPPGKADKRIGDHEDGDGLNNQRENLFIRNQYQNMARIGFHGIAAFEQELGA